MRGPAAGWPNTSALVPRKYAVGNDSITAFALLHFAGVPNKMLTGITWPVSFALVVNALVATN